MNFYRKPTKEALLSKDLYALQDNVDEGQLRIRVTSQNDNAPVTNARVLVSYTGGPQDQIEELQTDNSGVADTITLRTPPLEYSMQPQDRQPYAEYSIIVQAEGFREIEISGIEVMSGQLSEQVVQMQAVEGASQNNIAIGPHTLYGDYPPKIPEEEVKTVTETGEIVLSRVVIPEYVVVHDGPPGDNSARNYYVRYKDYIKNVASSEIYATWPDATIRANVLAIMSFTLNRVYTEWYRGKGYQFTITSSTAYDHKFIPGRNFYQSISRIVDEQYENYLSRPGITQPILTQYCDGDRVSCPNWMTQWGSKYLGDQGYSAIEILRYFYGSDMYINVAEGISGIPASWPGYNLTVGSTGAKVRQMQQQLARISKTYPAIPTIRADGIYGEDTADAVRVFQSVFGLPVTGVVDYNTWYEISAIYVAVTRIAELR
ncbi:MAG: peptidoglycan-binding protein [Agathobacter sp.]|nr:peptidoglycan-binding protein [Agathobacter sp.]